MLAAFFTGFFMTTDAADFNGRWQSAIAGVITATAFLKGREE
jgi:hypothetical protein